ncbi:PLDc N-terminal domain-containing protein [Homoserinimonas sp. OAct 916]|uniref:PLDc N-terminal domain-containing protein n=1 Tax=Homoserinimonas sp. OAct 916 TaxID=2211450 RepID=UPI000DBE719E|nr:PLDc N-terminal domain-containing protein [Homoserinimonas sp. OAct 916]
MLFIVLLFAAILVMIYVAISQIARASHLSDSARALWVLIVLIAPVIGAIAWFSIGSQPRS